MIYVILVRSRSLNEKKILRNPQEIDLGNYAAESPMQSAYGSKI